ncbi:MAG TPA: pyridoxamine kinase [Candidatus Monoglobus merdigallinarum]|uniref:pyridoxal kinase n=1 Tax=Candidatus Monoglobus merdigallinarum TaxID=2838698 RepID=A0A9D1TL68_9FIRM|nr:pyridoxamine kinase [Candidatus Monoglobus merdigallinarum]
MTEEIANIIPKVCAVHDISGFGKVSLTEVIPILSAMGVEVCPLPTAVLSTHTFEFENYTFCDLTGEMQKIIDHWEKIGLKFDAVYSGYMGSAEQIRILKGFMQKAGQNGALLVVDPVMGDNILSSRDFYSEKVLGMLGGMKELCSIADIITPNVTEACLLTGEKYSSRPVSNSKIKRYLKKLAALGAKYVVITSVMDSENSMCVAVYDGDTGKYYKVNCGFVNRPFHGTGDIYTSVLTGAMLKGLSIIEAANLAAGFVYKAIQLTIRHPEIRVREGVLFEPALSTYFSRDDYDKRYVEI